MNSILLKVEPYRAPKRNMKKTTIGLIALLVIYLVIVWPAKIDTETTENVVAENKNPQSELANPQISKAPKRGQKDPNFKPETLPDAPKEGEEGYFRVTNPDAIAAQENNQIANEGGPGVTQALTEEQIKESPQLQSVIKAMADPKEKASHVSALIKVKQFDKSRFKSDETYKEEYLNSAEPGRVFEVDSKSAHKLTRQTPYYQNVVQGESVNISVKAEPNMPVSITSFDLGKFGNHLTYQTVLADASGIATFEFFGVEGTFNDTKMLVSSPTSRGQLKFVVHTQIKTENSN